MQTDTQPVAKVTDRSRLVHYPIGRCEFSAYVFSGPAADVERCALFEQDAWSATRYVLPDARLDETCDYARTSGAALPYWPEDRVEPTDGVCFILSDSNHPAIGELRRRGAREYKHFVVADRFAEMLSLSAALEPFANSLRDGQQVVLFAYGDQGRQIVDTLQQSFSFPAERITILDVDAKRRRDAEAVGLRSISNLDDAPRGCAYVYTPYVQFAQLYSQFDQMRRDGGVTFDNSVELAYFSARGNVLLAGKAARVFDVHDGRLALRGNAPPAIAQIVRHDIRRFGANSVPHLHGGFSAYLNGDDSYDLIARPFDDRLGAATFESTRRSFVGLECATRGVGDKLGYFAAADFCREFWPDAVDEIFRARHWVELGRTSFERRIQRIISGFVIGAPKQTPEEQTALGVAACNYANSADAPIVEIGAALGGSTVLMAVATDKHRPLIHSIDASEESERTVRFVLDQAGCADRVRRHTTTSDDAIAELTQLRGRAGLVLIDGAHDAGTAGRDFVNYAPLVRPGGALLMHDFDRTFPGVMKVILGQAMVDARFEFKCLVDRLAIFERR